MIQPIETSEAREATPQPSGTQAVGAATPAGKSFAAHLASSKAKAAGQATRTFTTDASRIHDAIKAGHRPIKTPEGEEWRPVRGNDRYGHIVRGPRKGLYINLSHGARRGEVFKVEYRDGKRVHVYGTGDSQKVVAAAKDSGREPGNGRKGDATAARRPPNETWAPVPGHGGIVDILSGPRNGYYLNVSGNERDGQVFQMVFRHGQEYHVYGKGKDRQVILVRRHNNPLAPHGGGRDFSAAGRTTQETGGTRAAGGSGGTRSD